MDEKKHKDEELQTRREFFKKAAQKVLPMLGAIVVGPSFITSTLTSCEKCDGCESTCSDDCTTGCSGGCSGSCDTTCTGTSKGSTTCSYCMNTCKGDCEGTASGATTCFRRLLW